MINVLFWMFIWMAFMEDVITIYPIRKKLKFYKKGILFYLSIRVTLYIIVIVAHFLTPFKAFVGLTLFLAWEIFVLIHEEIGELRNFEGKHVFNIITSLLIIFIIYLL